MASGKFCKGEERINYKLILKKILELLVLTGKLEDGA